MSNITYLKGKMRTYSHLPNSLSLFHNNSCLHCQYYHLLDYFEQPDFLPHPMWECLKTHQNLCHNCYSPQCSLLNLNLNHQHFPTIYMNHCSIHCTMQISHICPPLYYYYPSLVIQTHILLSPSSSWRPHTP